MNYMSKVVWGLAAMYWNNGPAKGQVKQSSLAR